mgnify:CR=1 FL=1
MTDLGRALLTNGDMATAERVLRQAIDRLPVPYQVLVNGHYLKGLRYEELAAALGMPVGTVKTHLELISTKLNIRRRAERATEVARHDQA